jgi:hypothetical protein
MARLSGSTGRYALESRPIMLTLSFVVPDPMYGPAVRSKRFVDQVVSGLASMYPAFDWSIFSGPSWISARVRSH